MDNYQSFALYLSDLACETKIGGCEAMVGWVQWWVGGGGGIYGWTGVDITFCIPYDSSPLWTNGVAT